jgi:parallel beta-helix repeat protein
MIRLIHHAAVTLGLCFIGCNTPTTSSEILDPNDTGSSKPANGTGLNAEYFNNVDFTGSSVKRLEVSLNFDWGSGAPIAGINPDIFSARFGGELSAPTSGTYTFYATGSDGIRLNLKNKTVLDDYSDHEVRETSGTINLQAHQKVPLKLEYYKNTGIGSLKLEWSGPNVTRQIIPTPRLFTGTSVTAPIPSMETFYIAPNGNNDNPGTEALPWETIHKAVGTLTAGQTVLVKDGTYSGGLYIQRSGEPGKPITFKAFPGAKPIIDANQATSGAYIEGASYINIDGFDIRDTTPGAELSNGERGESGIAITVNSKGAQPVLSHHIGITNNRVHGFPGGGIGSGLADYITVEGNTISETALWSKFDGSAISLYQSVDFDQNPGFHNIIRGNTVFKNENKVPGTGIGNTVITDGNCIIIDDGRLTQKFLDDKTKYPAYKSSTLIENNICAGNGARGVEVYSSDNVLVRHNTFYKNLQTTDIGNGEHIGGGEMNANSASNVRFVNNIVYAQEGLPANGSADATNIVFENNLYFGTDNIPNKSPSDIIGLDPMFTNPSTDLNLANFRLKSGSPAIDKALAGQSPATDVGGLSRPQGVASDLGAWEFR